MKINQKHYHTIWIKFDDDRIVQIIDQRHLPHMFVIEDLSTVEQIFHAIRDMHVRGAPLIGVTAAYGIYLAALEANQKSEYFEQLVIESAEWLKSARPTAINLAWAVGRQLALFKEGRTPTPKDFLKNAGLIKKESMDRCQRIGQFGLSLIREIQNRKQDTINILTHCNAGWLACIDYGTATAPIYIAHDKSIPVHVWIDETRPRNQGARLTAFELKEHGVPHTVIVDNAAGHLMQHGLVDLVIVGTDRTSSTGDVCNKIGTYSLALAAKDNQVPFYVAVPSSSIDWSIKDGLEEIPIEKRDEREVKYVKGLSDDEIKEVLLTPEESPAVNYAFDVTPSRLVTGLITERGICDASEAGLKKLFR